MSPEAAEAEDLFDGFARLVDRARAATADVRLDLADDAEKLAHRARAFYDMRPSSTSNSVIRLIGEKCCIIANTARSRV